MDSESRGEMRRREQAEPPDDNCEDDID